MRAQRAIRAMAATWACTPQTSPTTSASWPRGDRRSRWCRRTWNAATWAAENEGRSRRSVTRIRPRRTGPEVVNVWTPAARGAATVVTRGLQRSGGRGGDVVRGVGIRRTGRDDDKLASPEPIKSPSIHDQPQYDGGSAEDVSGDLCHRERERRVARRIYGERIPQPWEECAGGRCDAHVPQERDDDVNDHRGLALTDARRMFGS